MRTIDAFYLKQQEPDKGIIMAIRDCILNYDHLISEDLKYGMPFFYYEGKRIAYIWRDNKTRHYYIGFVDGLKMKHPQLEQGQRKKMKILQLNNDEDLPIKLIHDVLNQALSFYKYKKD
jgi:hypothetical protein